MEFLHSLDIRLVSYVNSFVGQSELFDRIVAGFTKVETFKGGVVAAILCYVWLVPDGRLSGPREVFARSVIGTLIAITLARGLQLILPPSLRPLHDPALDFALPADISPETLSGWSSFPSDHAVLYFAVATAIFFADRRAGIFAYVWTVSFTCLPRVYVGYHYLADLLAGAAIGIVIMWGAFRLPLPAIIPDFLRRWEDRHAASLYVIAFLFAFQVATTFNDARNVLWFGIRILTGNDV